MNKENKKLTFYSELAMPLSMPILALAVAFQTKANFGLSMVVSSSYALSLKFTQFTFGMMDYTMQFLLLCLLFLLTKRWNLKFILAFVTSAYYAVCLDLMIWLTGGLVAETMVTRIIFFFIGQLLTALSVALFFRANLPLMAYDMFVKDLAEHKGWDLGRVKLGFDLSMLTLSAILSFFLLRSFKAIGIGTLFQAVANGPTITLLGKLLDRWFEFTPRYQIDWQFKKRKDQIEQEKE